MSGKSKPGSKASSVTEALYAKLVATQPAVQLKGATIPYTAVNGNMFSMLSKLGQVALRLPESECAAFIAKYKTKLHEEYGVVRREYVLVPPALLAKTSEIAEYFARSHAYTKALPAKATTRKATAAMPKSAKTKSAKPKSHIEKSAKQ